MLDVCVVGHITRDLIRIPGQDDKEMAGGSAYYASIALRKLGLQVQVVTKVAREDEGALLGGLATLGIEVVNGKTDVTTVFENTYGDRSLTSRTQRVRSVARPFLPSDLAPLHARAFHIGPLTESETTEDVIARARAHASVIALDAQGMLRKVVNDAVILGSWRGASSALPMIDVLKVDDVEATRIVGEASPEKCAEGLAALGAREVLVTFSDRGSLVRHAGKSERLPAVPPERSVDATGCGDTYVAGYLAARLGGSEPRASACFAAACASLKLERSGPFDASYDDARRRARQIEPDE